MEALGPPAAGPSAKALNCQGKVDMLTTIESKVKVSLAQTYGTG